MAVNFPSNPTNGQTITVSGITYAYDSTQGVWSDNPQGLTQAIDALTDVDTSTTAPTNGQILQWNSTDGEWQPADSSAGVTVYATIDDLPLTGVTEGSMALVDSTDKLYIFSDTGWYSISIVNTTPSISGVNATYTLATDGTATTVTVTATDPEGVPLTYSIVSDTSGNIATVSQGTGSNTNVWTITPSTNTANAGSFTLVFRASDGTNVASASSTFTLQFIIANTKYTRALITSVGANNAVNNSFDDASTNNHTITAYGNVTQNAFSPYRRGGYGHYFDGSGDYLSVGGSSNNETLSGDFCIEAWIYPTGTNDGTILGNYLSGPNRGWSMRSHTSNNLYLYFQISGGSQIVYQTASNTVNPDEWNHVVWCREGTDTSVFINGTRADNRTLSGTAAAAGGLAVGSLSQGFVGYHFTGYITDARVVNGSAVYDPSQTTLTVPTERLTAITNTGVLTCHLPYLADGSSNSHAIVVNGDVYSESISPYDYGPYSNSDHGGSIYFDGTGDYLSVASSSVFDFGSSDFTMECWVYLETDSDGAGGIIEIYSDDNNYIRLFRAGGPDLQLRGASGGTTQFDIQSSAQSTDTWIHVAAVRNGSTIALYLDGTEVGTDSSFTIPSLSGAQVLVGVDLVGTDRYFTGYISNARIVKGTAVYTSDFTPPTTPLTAISYTSLLLNGTDAAIIDKSQSVKTITLNGDVKSSTTQSKYLTSSMYFDGSNDYLLLSSDPAIGALDFTIESWIYIDATSSGSRHIWDFRPASNDGAYPTLRLNTNGQLEFLSGGSNRITSSAVATGAWKHVAVARSSGTTTLYIDGTSSGSWSDSTTYLVGANRPMLGGSGYHISTLGFKGYISDFRITTGLARYTSTFTPPSAALEG